MNGPLQAPEVVPEPGWTPLEAVRPRAAGTSPFIAGEAGRLRVAYFRRLRDNAVVGRAWFGPGCEGPPGFAHGGSAAAVLDDAMTLAALASGHVVISRRLTVDYRRLLPLGTDATIEAWVAQRRGRLARVRGRLIAADGVFVEATALFAIVAPGR